MIIAGSMTLLYIQFSLQYSFSILTTCSSAELFNYLTQHNIPFSATDTKKVLYEKIKQKKTPVVYKIDKIANLHGHEVLRKWNGNLCWYRIQTVWLTEHPYTCLY
jgi:hypothetical protein